MVMFSLVKRGTWAMPLAGKASSPRGLIKLNGPVGLSCLDGTLRRPLTRATTTLR